MTGAYPIFYKICNIYFYHQAQLQILFTHMLPEGQLLPVAVVV